MTRIALLTLIVFGLLASAAEARTCRDGTTVYREAGFRVFKAGPAWYGCGKDTKSPVRLYTAEGEDEFRVLGRRAGRLLFVDNFNPEGGGDIATVGWFDGRRIGLGELAGGSYNKVLDVVVAPDGGMGVAVETNDHDSGTRVGYVRPHRSEARPLELALAVISGYAKGSVTFTDGGGALTWRHADGRVGRSVPLTGEPVTCTSGTTVAENAGTRVFEVLPDRKQPGSASQADVLAVCEPGATTPRELESHGVDGQNHFALRSLARAGSRVAFVAGNRSVGLLDGPALDFKSLPDFFELHEIAMGDAGEPVLAGQLKAGGNVIARYSGEAFAAIGGDLAQGSLALTGDRVTWRTTQGYAQSAPLAGETTLDCGSGTTIFDAGGVRVFVVLDRVTRELGCALGASEPVELRGAIWRLNELARGRRLRGVAITPDGTVALAAKIGTRWVFSVLGRKEQVLATRTDGFAVGSLSIDGERVRWRNRAGGVRSARR
ncbi:hypothetical protein OJ998_31995 [Solirubrobacter taibaiensis]|nr:hypothetical protein [Solirubrobacter taibaiensis]